MKKTSIWHSGGPRASALVVSSTELDAAPDTGLEHQHMESYKMCKIPHAFGLA